MIKSCYNSERATNTRSVVFTAQSTTGGEGRKSVKYHRKRERKPGQRTAQIQEKLCKGRHPAGDQKARALRETVSSPQKEIRGSEKAQV